MKPDATAATGAARDRHHEEAGAPQHRAASGGHRRPQRPVPLHGHGVRREGRRDAVRRAGDGSLRVSLNR